MLREIVHFLRVAPTARRLKDRMAPLDCLELVERDLDATGKAGFRAALAADLLGDVLEIGAGTGLMLPHYGPAVRLVATDPDPAAVRRAVDRAGSAAARVSFGLASGEALPFPDERFDAVVCASALCSVRSVEQTLGEIRRVLRPGGELRLLEHVRSDRAVAGRLMDLADPIWLAMNEQGCHMNRDAERAARSAGFVVLEVRRFQLFAQSFPAAFPYRWIRAVHPGREAPDGTGR